jgi:hypothetical protein
VKFLPFICTPLTIYCRLGAAAAAAVIQVQEHYVAGAGLATIAWFFTMSGVQSSHSSVVAAAAEPASFQPSCSITAQSFGSSKLYV